MDDLQIDHLMVLVTVLLALSAAGIIWLHFGR
jgi:hypothetical protein